MPQAKIVLMDEPTAAISVRQVAEVLNLIRQLRDQGIAIVLISHRMPDVFTVADRVVVLRRGRKVADKTHRREFAGRSHGADHRGDRTGCMMAASRPRHLSRPSRKQHSCPGSAGCSQPGLLGCVAVIVACIILSFATNSFATSKNLFNITRNFTFVAIIALGMTIVIITGGIDLSVGSVLCLCRMVLAVIMHAGYSIEVGIAASLAHRAAVGAFNGVLIAYLGFPPFVVTLGMLSIARSLAMVASNNTAVFQFGPDHGQAAVSRRRRVAVRHRQSGDLHARAGADHRLRAALHQFGRYVFAIGGNEHAATLTGVPVRRIKVAVYMISALSAGIAGIIETGWLGAVTTNLGTGMELQVIAAAVIGGANLAGGVGTAFGALVGAALIEVIRNSLGLLGINAFWQGAFIGSAIIIAVAFERVRQLRARD